MIQRVMLMLNYLFANMIINGILNILLHINHKIEILIILLQIYFHPL